MLGLLEKFKSQNFLHQDGRVTKICLGMLLMFLGLMVLTMWSRVALKYLKGKEAAKSRQIGVYK